MDYCKINARRALMVLSYLIKNVKIIVLLIGIRIEIRILVEPALELAFYVLDQLSLNARDVNLIFIST